MTAASTAGPPAPAGPEDRTERLDLWRPVDGDLPELYALLSDPRVWTHFPSKRHSALEQTAWSLQRWMRGWEDDGLGVWIARERGSAAIAGYGGVAVHGGEVWNLGYRFAVAAQGRGYATELARRARERATAADPALPVTAFLLEHNEASAAVVRKAGLELVHRAPDAGNPDPHAMRLIFADRPLTADQLALVLSRRPPRGERRPQGQA